jgi:myo-inositol-1(or 4)-monophosphatase
MMADRDDLKRIRQGLAAAARVLEDFTPGAIEHRLKDGGDPVTEADLAVNDALLARLPQTGEGWLSEETVDDPERLGKQRVWVVDPVDGTREFVAGIPEWCISIGLVENGRPVAGGICNPVAGQSVVGGLGLGVFINDEPCRTRDLQALRGVEILASRSEVKRGEWERFAGAPFGVVAMGSVAYKLSLVAAGLADATWTLVPKHEWDVAAGTALVLAAGGAVWLPSGGAPEFNRRVPKFDGLLASPQGLEGPIRQFLHQGE